MRSKPSRRLLADLCCPNILITARVPNYRPLNYFKTVNNASSQGSSWRHFRRKGTPCDRSLDIHLAKGREESVSLFCSLAFGMSPCVAFGKLSCDILWHCHQVDRMILTFARYQSFVKFAALSAQLLLLLLLLFGLLVR